MKKKDRSFSRKIREISLSRLIMEVVMIIVIVVLASAVFLFLRLYRDSSEQDAVTTSEQAVVQVLNTVRNYTRDIEGLMEQVKEYAVAEEQEQQDFFQNLMLIRSEVAAVITYGQGGEMLQCWAGDAQVKEDWYRNLSYLPAGEEKALNISSPHVESIFCNEYPWVVTVTENMEKNGGQSQVAMDIRFSRIANYVDEVGIGQHGYCFIMDEAGNLIYHPQQQLLYAGLKSEELDILRGLEDGTRTIGSVIYTIKTLELCGWRIVGVCYTDEMITQRVNHMINAAIMILCVGAGMTLVMGNVISKMLSNPARQLEQAIKEFEKNAENFQFQVVSGTREINQLSVSFGHMVLKIQRLMEEVRQEQIILRKTELNALQAQINPHFLYNTLSSIAWMCEEGRSADAVGMVNALGQLFRISISKGHELIPIEKELQHAQSYLQIQNVRYKNQFYYEFDVDERCLPYFCNKITLQPIIENAIYHGIDRMVEKGRITISVHMEKENILMAVEDNGVGMTEEKCREILNHESGDKSGIGIKNVNDRIQIYFGKAYGISIVSEEDEGTRVEIRIPKTGEEDDEQRK